MKKPVNLKTFKVDHVVRSFKGYPLGRAILFDENAYFAGIDVINVSVLTLPIRNENFGVRGFQCYVDGALYQVDKNLKNIHITKKPGSWVITNVCLTKVCGDEEQD